MGGKYSAGDYKPEPRPPAACWIAPIRQELAVFDRGPPPGGERRLVRRPVARALEIQRSRALERDRLGSQPMRLKTAAAGGHANPRCQVTRAWSDHERGGG